jgi:hypothetical protein
LCRAVGVKLLKTMNVPRGTLVEKLERLFSGACNLAGLSLARIHAMGRNHVNEHSRQHGQPRSLARMCF